MSEVKIDNPRAEIDAIATNPQPPTFANTIAAMEDAGRPLAAPRIKHECSRLPDEKI